MEPGKRHALRAHMLEAATDWLNPLSLQGSHSDGKAWKKFVNSVNSLKNSLATLAENKKGKHARLYSVWSAER